MTKTEELKPPLFDSDGELLLEEILAQKDQYSKVYSSNSLFIQECLQAIFKLNFLYKKLKIDDVFGNISEAYRERIFYQDSLALNADRGIENFSIEADIRDDKKITYFWLSLRLTETALRSFINNDDLEVRELNWYLMGMVNNFIGMLNGFDSVTASDLALIKHAQEFIKPKNTVKYDYIRSLMESNPDKKYLALFADADKNIIGKISDRTFENYCAIIKKSPQK
ncbi:hypothetical protein [Polynucleobacter asymbioticus]|jgi:hypothetical protein|uniref:Uncharacterized protein n=1 Tax=Polynucleobacter asymbioticus TaxID=576611 RepID=A0AAC9NIS3_9BURK|nr:hypothetical protein [Polynucleobacter asymbioticus]APB98821.1 hypothetical protein A4F89_05510 [Polynucleobacter asymbioticus]APC01124.1 hypothetical protein AOC25_05605 [Polynucleobacter asymbioticus]